MFVRECVRQCVFDGECEGARERECVCALMFSSGIKRKSAFFSGAEEAPSQTSLPLSLSLLSLSLYRLSHSLTNTTLGFSLAHTHTRTSALDAASTR